MNLLGENDLLWAMRDACDLRKCENFEIATSAEQNKLMASLVPDQVICQVNNSRLTLFEGFLMYADIYGVSELCKKYSEPGKGGPLKTTQILNVFFGGIVNQILLHDGDILKFSGDSLLAFWKPTLTDTMREIAHKPLECALALQKAYGLCATDVDVFLQMKLIISVGPVAFSNIGDINTAHYVIYGPPVQDLKRSGLEYKAREIIVSSRIWAYTYQTEYQVTDLLEGRYQKLHQKKHDLPLKLKLNDYSTRSCVTTAERRNIHKQLEKFVIPPVRNCIKFNDPLAILSEMRQVVVVSINISYENAEPLPIIKLSNAAYKSVCRIVEERGGCITEVTLFDGELRCLVIFGLRGLKHESECRTALKCAARCRQAIRNINTVKSVSIGITTGKIYCGVCGHYWRKQYLVIGSIINQATRYTLDHINKIMCDHETFLNSRMAVENFILEKIEGFSPSYQYSDEVESPYGKLETVTSDFPLLAHHDTLELLRGFSESPKNEQFNRMLIIQGVAGQGKTRLLQEFVCATPTEMPVLTINLSENDKKVPFETLRKIFWQKLEVHPFNDPSSMQPRLTEPFYSYLTSNLYGLVNGIWHTDFDQSSCQSIPPHRRLMIERNFIRMIYSKAIKTKSIIIIDNLEYVDDESLPFIDILLESSNIVLLATIGYGEPINKKIETILKDERVHVARLKGIDPQYHAALACQLMNVHAIPPELESVIQNRSNGHPGWIKNFLFSLLQSGYVSVKEQNMNAINDAKLICPPRRMIEKYRFLLSTRGNDGLPTQIKAALLAECKCNIYNTRSELSMDTIVFKMMDFLLPGEQLVIKCVAILGDVFTRDMLLHVLKPPAPRQLAEILKVLFELKILACAEVDVNKTSSPQNNDKISCKCHNNKIHGTCQDLPKYASCSYMKFYNSHVRETLYQLSTEEQKRVFHLRAMEYLEKQRSVCRACDYGPLHHILDPTAEQDLIENQNNQPTPSPSTSTQTTPTEDMANFKSIWGFRCISKLKHSDSLIRDFSNGNIHDCQCLPFLTAAYNQLIAYYKSVDRHFLEPSKVIDIMLQYANLLIKLSKLPLALTVLNNTLEILKTTSYADLSWQNKLIYGKIYSLLGYVHMELGQFDVAEFHFKLALEQYHYKLSFDKTSSKFKILQLRLKHCFGLFVLPKTLKRKHLSRWREYIYNNASEVLSHLAILFMKKNQWDFAELAASWSLSKALKANNAFQILCTAYANMLTVALHYKRTKVSEALKMHALRLCKLKTENLTHNELEAVIKLHISIFWSSLSDGDIKKAREIGDIARRTATSINSPKLVSPILPKLMHCCVLTKHADAAV